MKIFYEEMTWLEVRECAALNKVALIPVGSVEDHGPHLPVMTDNLIISELCRAVGERIPEEVVVLPCVPYGFEAHHMDFPGAIDIHWNTLIPLWIDIAKSLSHHGFKKIVFANGHGSNISALDLAAREVTLRTSSLCACFSWYSLAREELGALRESAWPGGACHACEIETSLVMYLRPELVDEQNLPVDIPPHTEYIWRDLLKPSPVLFMDWWSKVSETGAIGDAKLATAEKGRKIFLAAADKMARFIQEFRVREIKRRKDYHL